VAGFEGRRSTRGRALNVYMECKASDRFWDILTSMKLFRCTCANILQIY
jgi:hypothetical protein